MFFALIFVCFRIFQIVLLIPCMGMLAWFVDKYTKQNLLTPDEILVLFIVSVLALAWAVFTLFSYHRSSANALFVGLVDLAFVGALIAGVYYLRGVRYTDCVTAGRDGTWTADVWDITVTGPRYSVSTDKPCAMLKASWAFGIINILLFFVTSLVAFGHGDRMTAYDHRHKRSGSHSGRHSHRHRSRSGSRSRYSHSSHSHSRRVYV